jgi:regulator of replication initiation timing
MAEVAPTPPQAYQWQIAIASIDEENPPSYESVKADLSPEFTSAADEFLALVAEGKLTPEQITEQDAALVAMFNNLHSFEDAEGSELEIEQVEYTNKLQAEVEAYKARLADTLQKNEAAEAENDALRKQLSNQALRDFLTTVANTGAEVAIAQFKALGYTPPNGTTAVGEFVITKIVPSMFEKYRVTTVK